MKITYFRLKGYIRVLNGMGLEEIVIPFGQFKNRIVLVQGGNGCAKSTIIAALNPTPDDADSFRTDVFIDDSGNRQIIEYPAEKEIHYIDTEPDGTVNEYKVLIQSIVDGTRTRRTTKAFISKNGEEFNPNGNVQSFKEMRDSLLGIDPIYLELSAITSENRGIVDMIPSERRKYMAAYIGSLDTYNNIFKVVSKKVSNLKSYMNTLNSKLYEIGDENELRLKLMQLETNLKEYNSQRDNILKDLSAAETEVSLIDPNNEMQNLYASISERLQTINFDIKQNQSKLERLSTNLGISLENMDIQKELDNTQDNLNQQNDIVTNNRNEISSLVSINEAVLNSINTDKSRLEELSSDKVQGNIEQAADKLSEDIGMYEAYLTEDKRKILDKVTYHDLERLKETTDNFKAKILNAEDIGTEEEFIEAVVLCKNAEAINTLPVTVQQWQESIIDNEIKIGDLIRESEALKKDLEILSSFDNTRPKECKIDSCPYIAKYMDMKKNGKTEENLIEMEAEINALTNQNNLDRANINKTNNIINIIREVDSAISLILGDKSIISKIPSLAYLIDIEDLKIKIRDHYRFSDFSIIDELTESASIYEELKKVKDQLKDMEADLKIYKNNKMLIDSLESSIGKNQKDYDERNNKITSLVKECNFIDGVITELSNKVQNLKDLLEAVQIRDKLLLEKEDLRNEFESVKDKIKLVKDKMDLVNELKNSLSNIEEAISPLNDAISEIKFNLANIVNYQLDYKESADKYDKMVFVRNACSPGNGLGIQSEYIKRYMNDIIIDCNKMLAYMFDGTIQLDVPIINEKQFSIPFLGPNGIVVPDISNGSTAQKCMIGLVFSCVAMMKSSLKYNIPRFDEIDGGLDQQNRITFITTLNQVLDFMRSEQCIICSHNVEFDTQNTTRLICSQGGIRIEQ